MMRIFDQLRMRRHRRDWRRANLHNETVPASFFPIENVQVGRHTYGPLNLIWLAKEASVRIGHYCSIGPEVRFLVGGEHDYRRISTWPFQSKVYHQPTQGSINRNIVVEDDVWIGYDALILSGVTIGRGAVIGARSVVTHDVPPYAVWAGNRVVRYRFSPEIIEKLQQIDFASLEHVSGDAYETLCQQRVTEENVEELLAAFAKQTDAP